MEADMTDPDVEELSSELDRWRARYDELRVQANLGKMELRDKLGELEERFEPAYRTASQRLGKAIEEGKGEAKTLAESLKAGWEAVRTTHRELREKSGD
jgi:hypothetical protein